MIFKCCCCGCPVGCLVCAQFMLNTIEFSLIIRKNVLISLSQNTLFFGGCGDNFHHLSVNPIVMIKLLKSNLLKVLIY